MLAAYGIDVLDPTVTARRLGVLLDRLPPVYRSPGESWSTEAHLLALLCDHVAELTYVTVKAAGGKAKRPKPIPRPPARAHTRQGAPAAGQVAGPRQEHRGGPGTSSTPGVPAAGKMGSWADAARAISGLAGVRVDGEW